MSKIRNTKALAVTPMRKDALEIAETGLQAIDTQKVIQEGIKNVNLSLQPNGRLFIVGIGKCAAQGVLALENELGDKITDGIVFDIQPVQFRNVRFLQGDHPFSTTRNKEATKQILALLREATENDTVLFLISAGGSALLCLPNHHTCEAENLLFQELFKKGVTIQELDTVRKHLSLARGGYLAQYAQPAKVISLIFSDVPGNDLGVISSGPTVYDESTKDDAKKVLEKYKLKAYIEYLIETPKDKEEFKNVHNILLISNNTALEAMKAKAEELGYQTQIKTVELAGEAKEMAEQVVQEIHRAPAKTVLLYGGETAVLEKNSEGQGGRNLEFGLSALSFVDFNELVLALASDGLDNTEFAGGIADHITKEHAKREHANIQEHIEDNESFSFFKKTGDYVLTGNTGSDVSDLIIVIKE